MLADRFSSHTSRSSTHRNALIRYRCYGADTDSPRQQHARITTSIPKNLSLSLDAAKPTKVSMSTQWCLSGCSPGCFHREVSLVPWREDREEIPEGAINRDEVLDDSINNVSTLPGLEEESQPFTRSAEAVDDALELKPEKDRLQFLLELSGQIGSNLELRDLLRSVSSTVRRGMQCEAVGVHLPDKESSSLRLFALDSRSCESPGEDSWLEESCSSKQISDVFRTRNSIVGGRQGWSPLNGAASGCGCAVPLISRDRVLGVLELERRRERVFAPEDVAFVTQIAGLVAIVVENTLADGEIKSLKEQLAREKLYLEDEIRSERGFEEVIGRSAAIRAVLRQIETVAPTDSTVLICGETGTGKELVARAIHERSARSSNAFVKLNCAAIPTGLLESELFGHERGAFTGAIMQRIGRFELANHGTAFLDEISEIPLELQPKLLRVLQEREFERLGSTRTLKTDARLIAATNRDLEECVEERAFRADLYYRLNVFPIYVPPLRERSEDIPLLVRHFAQHYARRMNRSIDTIPPETMEALVHHQWPGNIRELQNLIERSVILSKGPVLRVPLSGLNSSNGTRPDGARRRTLEEVEREHILATLKETKWLVSGPRGAAARLGMNRSTLQCRMKKLGLSPGMPIAPSPATDTTSRDPEPGVPRTLRDSERALILQALEATGWRVGGPKGAALMLGLNRTTLMFRMRKLGIERPFRRVASPGSFMAPV
jgi:formate hydrogenlyase transcriptional activator